MGKVLHASGSGYFNECVGVGAGKFGSGVFSLDHFMKMYWRAKQFKFSISGEIYVNWTFPPDPVDGIPGLFPFEYNNIILPKFNGVEDFEGVNPIVNEEQMVCGIIYYAEENVLPGQSSTAELAGVVATSNDLNNPATLFNFNPGQYFFLDAGAFDLPSGDLYVFLGSGDPFLNSLTIVESSINFGGVEVPGKLGVRFGLDYYFMDASQSSFTASFEVDEYFSFGGTINTSTGEPL
jgi:hypothetical protein